MFAMPFLRADLARPWLPELLATDASQDYGFGLSTCHCTPDFARSVARLAVQPGAYVEVGIHDSATAKRPKIGKPHHIGVHMSRFRTKLSVKAKYFAHSGALEAAGVSLMLRWLLRSPAKHGHRVAALVDAQAVLGAAAKGRSSSPTLRYELRRIAALCLAGGWSMHYTYVPSAFNPADAPSRGKALSGAPLKGVRKKRKTRALTPVERQCRDLLRRKRKVAAYRNECM